MSIFEAAGIVDKDTGRIAVMQTLATPAFFTLATFAVSGAWPSVSTTNLDDARARDTRVRTGAPRLRAAPDFRRRCSRCARGAAA